MSRYFLHVRDGATEMLDPEGSEFATIGALQAWVIDAARELMVSGIQHGVLDLQSRIDAEDVEGKVIYSLPFRRAVSIIAERPGWDLELDEIDVRSSVTRLTLSGTAPGSK